MVDVFEVPDNGTLLVFDKQLNCMVAIDCATATCFNVPKMTEWSKQAQESGSDEKD
jgi:hypothetical protein